MKTRRLFAALVGLFLCSLVWSTGCDSNQDEARATLEAYVLADTIGDREAAAKYLAEADREIVEERLAELKENNGFDRDGLHNVLKDSMGAKVDVVVKEAEVDGETMSVSAEVTRPNEEQMQKVVIDTLRARDDENEDASDAEKNEAFQEALEEALAEAEIETQTATERFELLKEGDKWLVFIDLATQQEIKELTQTGRDHSVKGEIEEAKAKLEAAKRMLGDRKFEEARKDVSNLEIAILYDGARKLEREDEFVKAVANYEKIIAIDPDWRFPPITTEKAEAKLSELKAMIAEAKVQDEYKAKIKLNDVEVIEPRLGGKRIEGVVQNAGDRVVDRVELAISFLGEDGTEVHSDSMIPVYALGKEAKAFKPGQSKKFTKYASNAPDAWSGEIDVKVSKVEFFGKK